MTIHFELPRHLERDVRADGLDLDREAKEAYLVDLYRRDRITHRQLGEALRIGCDETDGVLKRHEVSPNVTAEEMRSQADALRDARPE